jgi:hypothetical protein
MPWPHRRRFGAAVATGHDPDVGDGRSCLYPVPELNVFMRHGALQVRAVSAE